MRVANVNVVFDFDNLGHFFVILEVNYRLDNQIISYF